MNTVKSTVKLYESLKKTFTVPILDAEGIRPLFTTIVTDGAVMIGVG